MLVPFSSLSELYFLIYGQNLDQKEEVVALSKQDLNPEMTNKVIKEMTKLNKNKKFSISSFNNNGVEDLPTYLFE